MAQSSTTAPLLPGIDDTTAPRETAPTREGGLARLDGFAPRAGKSYASARNYDFGPGRHEYVSTLSPWIRHRLIAEDEVLRATLARHAPSTAEKFVQEVFWRGYFKGWLEHRPSVWQDYRSDLDDLFAALDDDAGLAEDYRAAIEGRTGIDAFDHWAQELVETGYLHNHARMWFASIWIFTLGLPWQLGADFFLRHLMDGDPASNTLSWRWVGGLHTKGKAYQARASNIAKYTDGRFHPGHALASKIEPLEDEAEHPKQSLPTADRLPDRPFLLLVTEEDCSPETWLSTAPIAGLALGATARRSPREIGQKARAFADAALGDAAARVAKHYGVSVPVASGDWTEALISAARKAGVQSIVTAYPPVGPVAEALAEAEGTLGQAGLDLCRVRRRYDDLVWPHATRGFFALKKKIPSILRDLGLSG
ncbi:FAD-binding domain-containing protein [Roseovarius aestuariivivens]|uniref:FAD-binding domain-containing protein n=1 Tax=Roseovarius aestuariivivens TaxID=1888910 RepID=UPI001080C7C2|nr:FAD-binding domain-containing protein [Roseovarius aestuariivivens]